MTAARGLVTSIKSYRFSIPLILTRLFGRLAVKSEA